MQFVDKSINRIIKWESVDVSIPEMLDLIQTGILEQSSSSDLAKLEKGMHKTWVLGVGNGFSVRYYPTRYSAVRLCCQFNVITHQLQRISLLDSINKKEYFIPSGKASCTKLQRAVLRRMAQYSCDESGVRQKSGNSGKYLNNKRRPVIPIAQVCCFVTVIAVVIGVIAFWFSPGMSTADAIATVQNGYLGEYTDLTVKEILDSVYGILYEDSLWDGGTTDSGKMIVQAKYFDETSGIDPTTIQFTMLNKDCFKITAFVDPSNPVQKSTDLFAVMNFNYLVAYVDHNRTELENNKLGKYGLILRLNQISGSAVEYGAAVGYSGDRAKICELNGETQLEFSVAMLLDNYGYIDIADYWGIVGSAVADEAEESSAYSTSVPAETEDSPVIETQSETERDSIGTEQDSIGTEYYMEGYVVYGSGGLNIRSGPGVGYEQVGRLPEGEYVTIWETQYSGTAEWGRIDRGWICLDYIQIGDTTAYYENELNDDFMVGEYWNLENGKYFWIRSDVTSNGNTIYWLEYPLGDSDGQGDVDKLVIPSIDFIPGNHGHSIYFHISDNVLGYYGDFKVSGYYADYGIDYLVSSSVYGLFDTGGDRVTVIGPWNEWGQD